MAHISIASYLNTKQPYHPTVGIICGSGLSGLSKHLNQSVTINYEDIPGIITYVINFYICSRYV